MHDLLLKKFNDKEIEFAALTLKKHQITRTIKQYREALQTQPGNTDESKEQISALINGIKTMEEALAKSNIDERMRKIAAELEVLRSKIFILIPYQVQPFLALSQYIVLFVELNRQFHEKIETYSQSLNQENRIAQTIEKLNKQVNAIKKQIQATQKPFYYVMNWIGGMKIKDLSKKIIIQQSLFNSTQKASLNKYSRLTQTYIERDTALTQMQVAAAQLPITSI